jgi:recombination protein RecR
MNSLDYPQAIQDLIQSLKMLPSIGSRSAERLALWMLNIDNKAKALDLARTISESLPTIARCPECGFFTDHEGLCSACSSEERNHNQICVVEQATDVLPIERCGIYQGLYHCLGGKLNPLEDVEPEDLFIEKLLERVRQRQECEVILATGSDVEGEATATYLSMLLHQIPNCHITRLAQGLPAGAGLGHADVLTLMKALNGRTSC